MREKWLALFVVLFCTASPGVRAVCEPPKIVAPEGQIVAERQPRVGWSEVAGATGYRVRLLSRVPNGRIVATHYTVVAANSFLAPQPLAEQGAKVTLRVNALCGAETSADTVAWFAIDTSPQCVLGDLSAEAASGRASLTWRVVEGARSYEVRAFALDGAFIAAQETRLPAAQVELRGRGAVVSVRPSCASGQGEAVYRTVAAD